jgi:hypothetical protein
LKYEKILLAKLKSDKEESRMLVAYALRNLNDLSPDQWELLAGQALKEQGSLETRCYLLSAALVTAPDVRVESEIFRALRSEFDKLDKNNKRSVRYEWCMALAEKGTVKDLPILETFLNLKTGGSDKTADGAKWLSDLEDVRSAAAYAILRIDCRLN